MPGVHGVPRRKGPANEPRTFHANPPRTSPAGQTVQQPAAAAVWPTRNNLTGVPQFDAPFRLDARGLPVTVEQGSAEEVGAAVYDVIACVKGGKLGDPDFGIDSPLFARLPLNLDGVVNAVRRVEPRATTEAVQRAITDLSQPVEVDVTAAVPTAAGS